MKLRVCATLLTAFTNLISSVSLAQMQWGSGMYGGMQACQGIGQAGGASSEDDEKAELIADRADLRREKREIEKNYRSLERDLDTLKDSITGVIKPNWATVIIEHMDTGRNCQICGTRPISQAPPQILRPPPQATLPPRAEPPSRITVIEEVPMQPQPQRPPSEPVVVGGPIPDQPTEANPIPPVRNKPIIVTPPTGNRDDGPPKPTIKPNKGASIASPNQSRMPASENVSAGAQLSGASQGEVFFGDDFGPDLGQTGSFDGSPTLCNPARQPYTMNAWRAICRDGGKIAAMACTSKYFQNGDVKGPQANSCGRALDRYRRLVVEMEKTQNRLAKIDEEIDQIGYQLKDIQMAERSNRDLEADCPSGKCYEGARRSRTTRGPTIGQQLLSMAPSLLATAGAIYLGYDGNKRDERTGNQTSNYMLPIIAQQAFGYPYGGGGLYGGAYGGVNGGFGCSPSMGPGGHMGPGGVFSPYGAYGNVGGAFGYPPGYGGYPQYGGGMYPPGSGPWGANGPWGVGQWPGGYPGYGSGIVGGIVGGIAGGVPGGLAGYPGMAGGYAGYPGMSGGYAGYPGIAGGIAGGVVGGIAGYPGMPGGYAGYPGVPGGYAGYPGIAGGIAGGVVGGLAGYPGIGAGVAGYAGMVPGYAGLAGYQGIGAGLLGQDSQVLQRQIEAQRSRLQLYQSFVQEYSSFQSKWNMYFGSGALGTDIQYTAPSTGGGSGPTSGTTGRSR